MSERIAVGAIAYGTVLAANAAADQFAAGRRLSRARAEYARVHAELQAARARTAAIQARGRR